MATPAITIFTPTYNRRYTLDRLFSSLCRQTNKNFEWIVIDDGSNDDTDAFFSSILNQDNDFPIIYKKKENGGKHRAVNDGVKISHGRLFFIVDSDDYLVENAIEKILLWESTLDKTHKWAGISGLKGLDGKKAVGGLSYRNGYVDAKNNEREKYNLGGDKAEVYFTNVLQNYPFPEFENEKFITESVVWDALARDGYYLRWFNEIIYICQYLEDGLTYNIDYHKQKSPKGLLYWRNIELEAYPNNRKVWLNTLKKYYSLRKNCASINTIAQELNENIFVLLVVALLMKLKIL